MKKATRLTVLVLSLIFLVSLTVPSASAQGGILDQVRARGTLNCGVNGALPGFSKLDSTTGEWSGFDPDFCRAVAAAIFGEVTKDNLTFVPVTVQERFTAVQTGTVDVLFRNATWTLSRDTDLGLDFGPVTFYDGQGLMVRADSGIQSINDMNGASICSLTGTTTEQNITEAMNKLGFDFELVLFGEAPQTIGALVEGRCDALTSDKSQLVSLRSDTANPGDYVILSDTLSKEPLGPAYIETDPKWANVIRWTVYATIQAEEYGITQANVDSFLTTEDPSIQRFLGLSDDPSASYLGLDKGAVVNIIRAVGNYGEIYNRNLGPDTTTPVPRGVNELWINGGLIYAPPWR